MYFSYTSFFLAMVMTHSTIFSSAKEFKPPTKQLDFPPSAQYLPEGIQITPSTDLSTQIVGGTEVYPVGRYEYMVSLQREGYGHFCGGSLVAPNWILTAAHCAGYNATHIEIGRHNLGVFEGSAETIEVENKIIHPGYDSSTLTNDVALIKLKENSSYTPVTLDNGSNNAITAHNADVTVFGWGTTNYGGSSSDKLLEVELDVVSNADCNEDYFSSGYITDDMICAARYGKGSCNGDSGGPLIMKGSNAGQDIQVGIVSWSYGCAVYPSVFSRVSSSYDWITSIISQGPCDNVITVRVKTDDFPYETSWSLIDTENNNAVIGQGGNYNNGDTLYETEVCVSPSCFSFTIEDSYGDGICCGFGDGYYQVLLDGEEVASGGEFNTSETIDFCSSEATPPTVPPNQPPSVHCDASKVTVRVNTDDYPSETSWSLIDNENNNAVLGQGSNYISAGTLYEDVEICVSPSCFSFTIEDSYGDGICCGHGDGYYQVLLDGEEVASGGEFSTSETKDFCSPETTPSTVSPNQPLTVSPNEPPSVYNGLINIYQCDKYTLEEIQFPPSLTEGEELTVCLENVGEDESVVVSEILDMALVQSEDGSSFDFGVITNGEEDLTNANLVTYWCEGGKCAASIVLIDEFFEYGEEITLGVTGQALLGSSEENGKEVEEENVKSFSLSVALDGGGSNCSRSGMLSVLSKAFGAVFTSEISWNTTHHVP